jgi:hypothetical protein
MKKDAAFLLYGQNGIGMATIMCISEMLNFGNALQLAAYNFQFRAARFSLLPVLSG